jgi:hypothetical protein
MVRSGFCYYITHEHMGAWLSPGTCPIALGHLTTPFLGGFLDFKVGQGGGNHKGLPIAISFSASTFHVPGQHWGTAVCLRAE